MTIAKIISNIFQNEKLFLDGGLTQKEVAALIRAERKKLDPTYNPNTDEQPNASKHLAKLIEKHKVYRGEDGLYYPHNEKKAILDKFANKVYCLKPEIFAIADTMYLIKVNPTHAAIAIDLLQIYFGEERCFDIFFSNDYLWVLWKVIDGDNAETEFLRIYKELSDTVSRSYERYIESLRVSLKPRKSR